MGLKLGSVNPTDARGPRGSLYSATSPRCMRPRLFKGLQPFNLHEFVICHSRSHSGVQAEILSSKGWQDILRLSDYRKLCSAPSQLTWGLPSLEQFFAARARPALMRRMTQAREAGALKRGGQRAEGSKALWLCAWFSWLSFIGFVSTVQPFSSPGITMFPSITGGGLTDSKLKLQKSSRKARQKSPLCRGELFVPGLAVLKPRISVTDLSQDPPRQSLAEPEVSSVPQCTANSPTSCNPWKAETLSLMPITRSRPTCRNARTLVRNPEALHRLSFTGRAVWKEYPRGGGQFSSRCTWLRLRWLS